MKPLVSILIPAYNSQEWIADTIRSAIGQTWQGREIIIVDDGSTDQTLAIARQFASKELKVVSQRNQGAAAARNKAFSLCQGDYIQWLDADDLMASDKISRQITALESGQERRVLLSSAWGRFFYRVSRAEFTPTRLWADLSPAEWLIRKMGENLQMQPATWLVSRDLSDAAGSWNTQLHYDDDGEYFCRVLLASEGVRFVPEARIYQRMSGFGSVSHIGTSNRKLDALLLSMRLHIRYLRSIDDSPRARQACLRYLQNWLMNFYPNRLDIVEELKQVAIELGGAIDSPSLSWKYSWLRRFFGWRVAKSAQLTLPKIKWSLIRSWDRARSGNANLLVRSEKDA
jgi:glycosyltransferase involved in cell wall biosynthesis